jgi:hypothetical protein
LAFATFRQPAFLGGIHSFAPHPHEWLAFIEVGDRRIRTASSKLGDEEKGDNLSVASLAKDNQSGELAGKLNTLPFRLTAETRRYGGKVE